MPHKNTVYHIRAAIDGHIHIGINSNIISVFQIDSISSHHTGFRCFQVQLFRVNNRFYIRRHSYRRPITAAGGNIDCLSCKVISQVLAISAYLTDSAAEYFGILLIIESYRPFRINNLTDRIFFGRIDVLTLTGSTLERDITEFLRHGRCCQTFSNFHLSCQICLSIFELRIEKLICQCVEGSIYQIFIFRFNRIRIQSLTAGTHRNTGPGSRFGNFEISTLDCKPFVWICRHCSVMVINHCGIAAVVFHADRIFLLLDNHAGMRRITASMKCSNTAAVPDGARQMFPCSGCLFMCPCRTVSKPQIYFATVIILVIYIVGDSLPRRLC